MENTDAVEAAEIVRRTMIELTHTIPEKGRSGSDARRAIGDLRVNALVLLRNDEAGQPMADCFDKARLAGTTLPEFVSVRDFTRTEAPKTLGGTLTRNVLIGLSLATEGRVIADMVFASRQDVEVLRNSINSAFASAEDYVADAMDSLSYRRLIELHASLMFYLTETARPLPRMLRFLFAAPLPTLHAAYKLYDNASRCDELRAENKVVHPAFMRRTGRALSS